MSLNPFELKPIDIESCFTERKDLYGYSYDKYNVSPYTKLRVILMNGTEFEEVGFGHNVMRNEKRGDLRRDLAMLRRSEQMQQKRIACLKPISESVLENTIAYEQLAVDLTATMAAREQNPYVKHCMDFALLEDFDHLYRYADLMNMETGEKAEDLVGSYTEIMPGRPTVSEHRHPYDDIKRPIDAMKDSLLTKLQVNIITAAEQQTMNYYMNQCGFYKSDLGRRLYQEIAMIEEQHVSQYGSLIDPVCSPLEKLLMHEYTEAYLYYSCYENESDPKIKKVWEEFFEQEVAHLHYAAELLRKYDGKEYQQVIPKATFPALLNITEQKDYVRGVLKSTVLETGMREDFAKVDALSDSFDFFDYQKRVNGSVTGVASHEVIEKHIKEFGEDYRFEEREHPVVALRKRDEDNYVLGRVKGKIGI